MTKDILNEILLICDLLPDQMRAIAHDQFFAKPLSKWSRQEVLGHLIDSAKVNTERFVRGQIENNPQIFYDQDDWVAVQDYQHHDKEHLIVLWESLNRHLVHVATHISEKDMERTCMMRNGQSLTLQFLIEDYLNHLQHHIGQIIY